jgi:sarcosine oxidase/L-pipecolate oxidase
MVTQYIPPVAGSKIIIVGGGCFGLSTAYALSLKNQYDITVFDRQTIPAPDAASSGMFFILNIYSIYTNFLYSLRHQ